MEELIGKAISHYRIEQKIGEGGMGIVFKGTDEKLGRCVALKFLATSFSNDAEHKQRFINEAKAASAIDHPNICTIHEIDETDEGQLFIVMSYYQGESLKQRLAREPILSPAEATSLTLQILDGLAAAHHRDIVHRDIKPANTMITPEGTVKILDFGLAKLPDVSITRSRTSMGTIAYASPEQLRGEAADPQTDIWATGVIMYEMLTGKWPFKGDNEYAIFYDILNDSPLPLRELNPEVPETLQTIVMKALEKRPENRYENGKAMRQSLLGETAADPNGHPRKNSFQTPSEVGRVFHWKYIGAVLLLLALLSIAYLTGFREHQRSGKTPIRIAVLPLDNISPVTDKDYFTEGMTEELISRISTLKHMDVISKASTDRYRSKPIDLKLIAGDLNVSHVITGSVRQSMSDMRISIQLINIDSQSNIWSQTYDRQFSTVDIFAVQEDIARNVAAVLDLQLNEPERRRLEVPPTGNLQAYERYLQGRYNMNLRTPESLQRALGFFEQAVALDSAFALAYTGVANTLALFSSTEYSVMPAVQVMPKAKKAAMQAIVNAPELAAAHTSLANIYMSYDWDMDAAERSFQRAIAINQNDVDAHHWYAIVLMVTGREEAALASIDRALALDPVSLVLNTERGWLLRYARRYAEADRQFRKTLNLDPDFVLAYVNLGMSLAAQKKFVEALDTFLVVERLLGDPTPPISLALTGFMQAVTGKTLDAQRAITQLEMIKASGIYVNPIFYSFIFLGMDDRDRLYDYLEQAYRERSNYMIYLPIEPLVDSLRNDDRFQEILKRISQKSMDPVKNLTAAW